MKKYIRYVLVFLIIVFLILILRLTYSRYITKFDYPLKGHINAWNIKVNDQDILENKDFSETLNITYTESEYIDPTVIAPTSEAYFTVEIDSTGTEVDFEYKLSVAEIAENSDVNYSFRAESEPTTSGSTTTYHLILELQDMTSTPIYTLDGATLTEYNGKPLSFDLPAGVTLNATTLAWADSISQSGTTVTIVPKYTAWNNTTNSLTQSLPLAVSSTTVDVSNFTILELCKNVKYNDSTISSSLVPDFRIIGYEQNSDPYVALAAGSSELTGTITHSDDFTEEVVNTFKFYVQWYDEDDNILDNSNDVRISKVHYPVTQIPVNLTFTQIED